MKKIEGIYHQKDHIESEIKCPYCEHLFTDSWELNNGEEGELETQECPACNKKFMAERCITIDYRTNRACELNNEEHEWKKADFLDDAHECLKCGIYGKEVEV